MLEFNQCQKSDIAPFIIYVFLESLIENIDGCKIIQKIYLQQKQTNIFWSGFPMPKILSFKNIENKHDVFRGRNCILKLCESLRKHAEEVISFFKN